MKKRNSYIDLLKFLFALSLIIYHGRLINQTGHPYFSHGYFAVEFFFIVSGYYMCKTAVERKTESGPFLYKKYLGFFPYHIYSFIGAFAATIAVNSLFTFHSAGKLFYAAIPEILILPTLAGLKFDMANINGIEWYLAAMLLAMAILYPLVRKYSKYVSSVLSPLLFLFLSGYLYNVNDKTYNTISAWNGFLCLGVVRAVAEVAAGCFIYYLTTCTKDRVKGKASMFLLTILDLCCWVVVFWFMNSGLENKYEFATIYLVIFGLYLIFSNSTLLAVHINSRFFSFLGKLSFPMFLNQSWIRKVFIHWPPHLSYRKTELAFLGAVIGISLLCVIIVDPIVGYYRKRKIRNA